MATSVARRCPFSSSILDDGGSLARSLCILPRLDQLGITPSSDVYISILRICKQKKALSQTIQVYYHIRQHGIDCKGLIGEHLVIAFANCGELIKAQHIFSEMSYRPASTWAAMIFAHVESGLVQEAVAMYRQMREESLDFDYDTFNALLKACSDMGNLEEVRKIHNDCIRSGISSDVMVGGILISTFVHCGSIMEAEGVFVGWSQRNIVMWNIMMSAYHEQPEKALFLYRQMQDEGMPPIERTFVIVLHALSTLTGKEECMDTCGSLSDLALLKIGQALHADARKMNYASQVFVGGALVSLYGKCGSVTEAEHVFTELRHDVVSWTAMLRACVEQDQAEQALWIYKQMQVEGFSPNQWTFGIALQACCSLAERRVEGGSPKAMIPIEIGMALHSDIKKGMFPSELFVTSILITMYGKCGRMVDAESLFCALVGRDIVTWNGMLSLYVEGCEGEMTLRLYRQMRREGIFPNKLTLVLCLQACCLLAEKQGAFNLKEKSMKGIALEIGCAFHAEAKQMGFSSEVLVKTALLSMYGKCGCLQEAELIFDKLVNRTLISWNAMLSLYAECGQVEKAWELYEEMKRADILINEVTLLTILQVCSETGNLEFCRQVHFGLVALGFHTSPLIVTTLIHAYGNCPSNNEAQEVFDVLLESDVVSWNALCACYAHGGDYLTCQKIFKHMLSGQLKFDRGMFVLLLWGCDHAGLVDECEQYFKLVMKDQDITPDLQHYLILVDLFGRVGDFSRLEELIWGMPLELDLSFWQCVLRACQTHGYMELAKHAYEGATLLCPEVASVYVLLSNIFTDTDPQLPS